MLCVEAYAYPVHESAEVQGSTAADLLWADVAVHYNPDFKIADVATGLRFGFEVAPRICFERNHRQLPFGCHAWPRYDREFWEPYLLKEPADEPIAPGVIPR